MGTPQFAVPFLTALIEDKDFDVVAVITQPDKPTGRKQIITPPPIKDLASDHEIEVLQPENLKNDTNTINRLKELNVDLSVVIAYGQIIPQEVLNIFRLGNINVHPSILPKYRGASPIQNTILHNDKVGGITIMLMDEKMDHGPILAQQEMKLDGTETNESLHNKMSSDFGIDLLLSTIKQFLTGAIQEKEQAHDKATYCKQISKDEAKINWTDNAENISAKIRAFYPWPITWTKLDDKRVKIFPPIEIIDEKKSPGEIFEYNNKLAVSCQDKSIVISELQLEGKSKTTSEDFVRGNSDIIGKQFK